MTAINVKASNQKKNYWSTCWPPQKRMTIFNPMANSALSSRSQLNQPTLDFSFWQLNPFYFGSPPSPSPLPSYFHSPLLWKQQQISDWFTGNWIAYSSIHLHKSNDYRAIGIWSKTTKIRNKLLCGGVSEWGMGAWSAIHFLFGLKIFKKQSKTNRPRRKRWNKRIVK